MRDLDPSHARLAASLAALAPSLPCPTVTRRPRERAEPAVNKPSSPLPAAAPLCCLHQNQHVFKSASIFNENFCVYAFFGLGTLVFWPPSLFGFLRDRCWLCAPVSLDRVGCVTPSQQEQRHRSRIPAAPASPAASLAARPCACLADPHRSRFACSIKHRKRRSHSPGAAAKAWQAAGRQAAGRGPRVAGHPFLMGVSRLPVGKELPGKPNRFSQGKKQIALDLESSFKQPSVLHLLSPVPPAGFFFLKPQLCQLE